jgi:hypothetical protein
MGQAVTQLLESSIGTIGDNEIISSIEILSFHIVTKPEGTYK